MKKVLFIIALLFSLYSKSQLTYQWAYQAGGTVFEYGQAIAVDPSGNVYVAGTFSGTVDFDPSASTANLTGFSGSADIFLAKYTSSGAFIWVKQIGGTNTEKTYDLAADATGAWLAGNFMGTCDFDPSASTSNTTSLGGGTDGDGFFAKYDASGNYVWGVRLGSTANDRCIGIAVDASQNAFVTGFIGFNADMDPSAASFSLMVSGTYNTYFAKYTSAGSLTFAKQITGGYSEGDDIAIDGTGNIYLTGSYATSNDFDPSAATANLSTSSLTQLDIYLAKYDALGNYTFAKQIGGIGVDIGFQVKPDINGDIYLGGVFSNTCDFDPTATVNSLTSAGQGDLFVAKYTSGGNLIWKNGTGGTGNDYCYGLGTDASSNVYITGRFQGTNIDFDPSASTNALTATSFCPYVAGYNSSGGFLFANSPGDIPGEGRSLVVSTSVYVTGFFSTTGDFDFSASTANLTSLGSSDVFFAKYNVCTGSPPAQPSAISGTTNMCFGTSQSFSVVNDPTATGYVWSFPSGWSGSSSVNSIVANAGTTGTISVAASNSCGLSPYSTLNVTVNPLPTPTFTNSGPVCSGSSLVIGANGASTYSIYGPASFAQITQSYTFTNILPINAGAYTVVVTSAAGCTALAQTTVVINPLPTLSVNNPSVCSGGNLTFTSSGASTFTWSGPNSFASNAQNPSVTNASTLATGQYTLKASTALGCTNSAVSNATVSPTPTPGISSSATLCSGNTINLTSTGGGTYQWYGPNSFSSTNQNPSITTSSVVNTGAYTVVVTVGSCSAQISNSITVNPTPTISVNNPAACIGSNLNFTSSGASTYTWSGPNSYTSNAQNPAIPNASLTMSGQYTVIAASAQGCTNSAVSNATVAPAPNASISPNSTVCSGNPINLTGSGGVTYQWNGPNSFTSSTQNPTLTNSSAANAGTYTLLVSVGSCTSLATTSVTVNASPTVAATSNMSLICLGQTATLTASGANSYTWSTSSNSNSIIVSPSVTTSYTLNGTTSLGCTGSTIVTQNVSPCSSLIDHISVKGVEIYPNPFGDELIVKLNKESIAEIFNSLGQRVASYKLNAGTGKLNTENLAKGIYFIRIDDTKPIKLIKD